MAENDIGEQLKTISNLVQVAIIIYGLNRDDLLPSILELIFLEAQALIDDHCLADK